jgi:hypothetical protein
MRKRRRKVNGKANLCYDKDHVPEHGLSHVTTTGNTECAAEVVVQFLGARTDL